MPAAPVNRLNRVRPFRRQRHQANASAARLPESSQLMRGRCAHPSFRQRTAPPWIEKRALEMHAKARRPVDRGSWIVDRAKTFEQHVGLLRAERGQKRGRASPDRVARNRPDWTPYVQVNKSWCDIRAAELD